MDSIQNLRDAPSRDKCSETKSPKMVGQIVTQMLASNELTALAEALRRQVGEAA